MSARVLAVGGHDPTRGAGVEADRAAIERFGAEAECVVTAWTDQDGERVRALGAVDPREWLEEARYALAARIGALKSGLLPGAVAVRTLATLIDEIAAQRAVPVVVDPVLAASGGEVFLDDAGIAALLADLLRRGAILTPNLPEAARLSGLDVERLQTSGDARVEAARALLERGARAVVLKGGHAADSTVRDLVLERGGEPAWLERPRLPGARLHGSGCRFASAVAAQLARGTPLEPAARAAGDYVAELLRGARR